MIYSWWVDLNYAQLFLMSWNVLFKIQKKDLTRVFNILDNSKESFNIKVSFLIQLANLSDRNQKTFMFTNNDDNVLP